MIDGQNPDGTVQFKELMAYKENVFRICLGFSRNSADAEDLVQDVYLKAYKKIGSLRNQSLKKEWLFRIARNTCLDHQKRMRIRLSFLNRPKETMTGQTDPEPAVDHKEQVKRLKSALNVLPRKQKEVFVLREYGHLTYEEIARTLGIKMGTVMSRLNRARQAIINRLEVNHGKRNE